MVKLFQPRNLLIFFGLLLCLQVLGWSLVKATESSPSASPLVFTPAQPKLETFDEAIFIVSGTTGKVKWEASKGEIRGSGNQVTYIAPAHNDFEIITVTDEAGNTGTLKFDIGGFVDLQIKNVLFFLIVGFISGLVSGFIGASGAFILTPAMMAMGIPAIVAVATNMCHKFPWAMVSVVNRVKAGQLDFRLLLVMGISAEAGIMCGALLQTQIKEMLGDVGSNLYVSLVFVGILAIVGSYILFDAWKIYRKGGQEFKTTRRASWAQSVHFPGTMMYFPSIGTKVSVLLAIPIGFVTGFLGATIAVGGFVGVPAMMYILGVPGLMASTTQIGIAFIVGIGGTIQYAISGFVDIRLAMILLAGSLFGTHLGAIATSYVKDYMVKVTMGVLMILILFNLGFKIPVYLSYMGYIEQLSDSTITFLDKTSFDILILALVAGAATVLYALINGSIKHVKEQEIAAEERRVLISKDGQYFPTSTHKNQQLSSTGRLERILLVTDRSDSSADASREAIRLAQRTEGNLSAISVVVANPEHEYMGKQIIEKENDIVLSHLEEVKDKAEEAGVECEIGVRHGIKIYQEIIAEADQNRIDVIVMGRRGYTGLMRIMMGSNTAKVIGQAHCSILIVPKDAQIEGQKILLPVDGSRYSDVAANTAINIAKHLHATIMIVSVVYSGIKEHRHAEAVELLERMRVLISKEGISVESKILGGKPADAVVEVAKARGVDLIVMGSHGRTGLDKVLMGSVSDQVISHTECAVLVVKAN